MVKCKMGERPEGKWTRHPETRNPIDLLSPARLYLQSRVCQAETHRREILPPKVSPVSRTPISPQAPTAVLWATLGWTQDLATCLKGHPRVFPHDQMCRSQTITTPALLEMVGSLVKRGLVNLASLGTLRNATRESRETRLTSLVILVITGLAILTD